MAGLHLQQLQAACVALATTYNEALEEAELAVCSTTTTPPARPGKRLQTPRLEVGLGGDRQYEFPAASAQVWERLRVAFAVIVDDGEANAAAYEGILATVLRDAQAAVAEAVTDATVQAWLLADGESGPADDNTNAELWTATVTVEVTLEW